MQKSNHGAQGAHREEPWTTFTVKNRRIIIAAALAAVLIGGHWSWAQFPSAPEPKHYAWSDASLSPDERADMVLKEMTLEEKISLLLGRGMSFGSTGPTESNGGAGYTNSIPHLGIPAIQMADSAYGVTRGRRPAATRRRCPTTSLRPRLGIRRLLSSTVHSSVANSATRATP